jgi:hypothetical protein
MMAAGEDEPERKIVRFPATQKGRAPRGEDAGKPEEVEPLSSRALLGIGIFIVVLVVAGVWLMNTLREIGQMQDCAMQGRRNCAPIEAPPRDR